jgi:EAL domain-containing protein (putative c-di-GMP-specific phosphodiesterase class I)
MGDSQQSRPTRGAQGFGLVYQPIVHLDRGDLAGVEALCRFDDGRSTEKWFQEPDPEHAADLDLAIIATALADLPRLPRGYLAVNLSASTVTDPRLAELLLSPAVPAERLVVELTEHAKIADYQRAREALAVLRGTGIRLAVDDAGAGYATFRHILSLRPDIIKMDQSITSSIDTDPARRALATAMVIFAGEIGATVVAEGVETPEEIVALRSAGIHRAQGFALARPQRLPLAPLSYSPMSLAELLERSSVASEPVTWARLDASVAVTAHGLLSAASAVQGALGLLARTGTAMDEDQYRAVVGTAERQAQHLGNVLQDLVRGLPPGALSVLDALTQSSAVD